MGSEGPEYGTYYLGEVRMDSYSVFRYGALLNLQRVTVRGRDTFALDYFNDHIGRRVRAWKRSGFESQVAWSE